MTHKFESEYPTIDDYEPEPIRKITPPRQKETPPRKYDELNVGTVDIYSMGAQLGLITQEQAHSMSNSPTQSRSNTPTRR